MGPGGIVVVDSAYPGDRTPGWRPPYPAETNWLAIPLAPATYRVRSADHRPDDRTHFYLVELRRMRPRSTGTASRARAEASKRPGRAGSGEAPAGGGS